MPPERGSERFPYESIARIAADHDDFALATWIEKRIEDGLAVEYPGTEVP